MATPDAPEDWRRGCPPGFPRARRGGQGLQRPPPRSSATRAGAPSPPARPRLPQPARAPLHLSAPRPARAPNLPRCAGAGTRAGCVDYIGVGRAPPAHGAGALGGFILQSNSRCLWLLLLFSPQPRPLLLSCLSALFSGLITFRIKAKPSPGCEYNAPPSPLGEERGAGAPRGGRGRGRARRAARRRRGGLPGGGPGPPRQRL